MSGKRLKRQAKRVVQSALPRITLASLGFLASAGVASASTGGGAMVLLQICSVPGLGDFAAWLLPNLRQLMIYGGAASAAYGVLAAPVEGGRMSPRGWILLGLGAFAVGVLWVSLVTYFGTDVLGGDQAVINAATCGIDTGA